MEKLLENQVALVTGASSGIGYGVAQALANAGAAVVLNYHTHAESAEKLADEIEKAGGAALALLAHAFLSVTRAHAAEGAVKGGTRLAASPTMALAGACRSTWT